MKSSGLEETDKALQVSIPTKSSGTKGVGLLLPF
jgi:hypothetical protein